MTSVLRRDEDATSPRSKGPLHAHASGASCLGSVDWRGGPVGEDHARIRVLAVGEVVDGKKRRQTAAEPLREERVPEREPGPHRVLDTVGCGGAGRDPGT